MSEPWICRASQAGKYDHFELHLGGNIYVLSLEDGEKIARDILGLLYIEVKPSEVSE